MTQAPPKLTPPVGRRDHAKGPASAPVTLVEYGDFECPHCLQVHPITQELQGRMGERMRYVYRHFPIRTSHPHAQLAAEAAEAAAAQGRFWEMHNKLFENQEALQTEDLIQYAAELDLDIERFERELTDHTHSERVREDFRSGIRSGANGTPTFFINGVRYDGAWDLESLQAEIEKPLGVRIRYLFREFARLQASGGILLLLGVILAVLLANSPLSEFYFQFWDTELSFQLGRFSLSEHLLEWVNDALMVVFFFVVGLEIKREVTVGELAAPRRAALPVMAALGGMIVPAAIYLVFNSGTAGAAGWGIPMATDIAFTLGILTVLGGRVPLSLKVFFTAMAIADDIGAVLVIAIFYTSEIVWISLAAGAGILLILFAINRFGIFHPLPYGILGVGLWLAFLESGVHPSIAGVLLALTIPTRPEPNVQAFLAQCQTIFGEFDPIGNEAEREAVLSGRRQAAAQALERILERMQSPAQRLQRSLHPWTTYVILPVFALANAGVEFSTDLSDALSHPVSLGIMLGLVIGKAAGLSAFSWLAVRTKLAELPADLGWAQIFSASWLAGIGFTISLFIADAAFTDPELLSIAKISVFAASLLASVIGLSLLALTSPRTDQVTKLDVPIEAVQVSG